MHTYNDAAQSARTHPLERSRPPFSPALDSLAFSFAFAQKQQHAARMTQGARLHDPTRCSLLAAASSDVRSWSAIVEFSYMALLFAQLLFS
jgi:hypothetical protein